MALFIPPEMLDELWLGPDAEVELTSEGTSIRVRRAEQDPPDDLIDLAYRFS